jgi:O-antigen ligase
MLIRDRTASAGKSRIVVPAHPSVRLSRRPASRGTSGRAGSTHSLHIADALVGMVFGLLAGSNLVQGVWISELPWLNLTTLSFALAVPATLFAITRSLPLSALFALLLLIGSLSLGFVQVGVGASAEHKRIGIVFAVVFVTTAAILTLTNRRRLIVFFGTVTLLGLVVVASQFLLPDPAFLSTGRRTPLGLNSIGAGRVIGAGFILVIAALTAPCSRRRVLPLILLSLPLGFGLVLTGSRGPVAGVAAAVLFLLWRHPRLRLRLKVALTGLLLTLGYLAYSALLAAGARAVSSVGTGRSRLYADAVDVAIAHPAGIGWGNFYRYVQYLPGASEQGEPLYAHNIFLEFWIEAGVAGALLFVAFLAVVASRALRQTETPLGSALGALALSLLVGALFSSDIIGNRMMWVVFGAILAGASGVLLSKPNSGR